MYITNTAGCASGGSWESYATSKVNWTPRQTNATATVYVKFRDVNNNESACIIDTIIHDNQDPVAVSLMIASSDFTSLSSPTVFPSATGADEMYLTNIAGCGSGGTYESYSTTRSAWGLSQTNALATVYIKFRDLAGNESLCISDTITHDNVAPQ